MSTRIASPARRARGGGIRTDELAALVDAASPRARIARPVEVRGVTGDSRRVELGSVFAAIRGTKADGHDFVDDAIARGAVAAVVEKDVEIEDSGIPLIRVDDSRAALAKLAAAFHGHPARHLTLVGITGTVGKTTILTMLESIQRRAGGRVGTIGSLGVRIDGRTVKETRHTSPDPVELHEGLSRIAEAGCGLAAMEVTSHALVQRRVHGLEFDLGVFTNLIPLEHADFHKTFRNYVEAKRGFLDYLRPCTPLVYNADDRTVRRIVHHPNVEPVPCGLARTAVVRIEECEADMTGTRLTLNVRRPIPGVDGVEVQPRKVPLRLRLLGRANVSNAALAATAALCLGAAPEDIAASLRRFPPPRRRMEILHRGSFTVMDDTVAHPDSVSALFETVEQLRPRRVLVAFAVRGCRGVRINKQVARALAIWAGRVPIARLIVTRSAEATDERNRVTDREFAAFRQILSENRIRHAARERLDDAVTAVLDSARPGDLVLLLGAQGMDAGRKTVRRLLAQ